MCQQMPRGESISTGHRLQLHPASLALRIACHLQAAQRTAVGNQLSDG